MKIPLNSGAYTSRSLIADAQVCENLFPELNPQETSPPFAVTHYPRAGNRPLSAPPAPGRGRGVFALSNGNLYAVVGAAVYYVDANWAWTLVGQITPGLSTPVSIADNGGSAVIVDGSPNGYVITMATNAFAAISDPTGTFVGSVRTDFSDTFFAFAAPGTNAWYLSNANAVTFNALVQEATDSKPDPIETIVANIRQYWVLKSNSTEVWYLAGGTPFPYQPWPNVFVPYGCVAPYSVVQSDVDVFWLGKNNQGQGLALKSNGYEVAAISTRALEDEWQQYPSLADVVGGTYQQGGHTFIVFHFPTADRTWKYDISTKQWHRGVYIDQNGVKHAERTRFYASVGQDPATLSAASPYPRTIVGQDWATGQLYAIDPTYYTDNGQPIVFRRSFPHVLDELKFLSISNFVADIETGGIVGYGEQPSASLRPWNNAFNQAFGPILNISEPTLFMRSSKTGGATWSNYRPKRLVSSGHYRSYMRWPSIGQGRDFVFELTWAYPGRSALNGAYIDPIKHAA